MKECSVAAETVIPWFPSFAHKTQGSQPPGWHADHALGIAKIDVGDVAGHDQAAARNPDDAAAGKIGVGIEPRTLNVPRQRNLARFHNVAFFSVKQILARGLTAAHSLASAGIIAEKIQRRFREP